MKKVNQVKTKKALEKRLKELEERFQKEIHINMVEAVNSYHNSNGDISKNDILWSKEISGYTDSVCLSGAWLKDRLMGYTGTHHHPTYGKTLTKKIRRALGYVV